MNTASTGSGPSAGTSTLASNDATLAAERVAAHHDVHAAHQRLRAPGGRARQHDHARRRCRAPGMALVDSRSRSAPSSPEPSATRPSVVLSPAGDARCASSPSSCAGRAHLHGLGARRPRAPARARRRRPAPPAPPPAAGRGRPAALTTPGPAAARPAPSARDLDAGHGVLEARRDARQHLGVLEVGHGLDDRPGAAPAGPRSCRCPSPRTRPRRRAASSGPRRRASRCRPAEKLTTGRRPSAGHLRDQLVAARGGPWPRRAAPRARGRAQAGDAGADGAHVAHGLDHVAGAGLALGADHRRALGHAPQRLAQVGGAAHERAP